MTEKETKATKKTEPVPEPPRLASTARTFYMVVMPDQSVSLAGTMTIREAGMTIMGLITQGE